MDHLVILHKSIFMICFMKNIKFEDMMKLFYTFEFERKVIDSGL